MAEQDKNNIVASSDSKDVAKLESTNEVSFEFSMVRRRSLDEVRWTMSLCVCLSQFVCCQCSKNYSSYKNLFTFRRFTSK